jgi:hypothetical protein
MRLSVPLLGFTAAACLTAPAAFARPSSKPPTTGKPTTVSQPVPAAKPAAVGKPMKSTSGTTSATPGSTVARSKSTTTHTAAAPTTSSTPPPLNPIAAKIASKPNLSAKIRGMLPLDPVTGRTMTLNKASWGFKNQGQFIAALHVSQNLGVPFSELKSHMVTVTPGAKGAPPTATQTGSLGQAIQAVKSTANVPTETDRAETQATVDLRVTASSPTPTAKKRSTTQAGAQ